MFVCSRHFPVEMLCSGALPRKKWLHITDYRSKSGGGVGGTQIMSTQQNLEVSKLSWRDDE